MTKRLTIALVALAVFLLVAVMPASAGLTANVSTYGLPPGTTVFIGENQLNLSRMTNALTQPMIAWWPSTAAIDSTTPEKVIDISATNWSFYVNPTDFQSRTGNWYCYTYGKAIFNSPVAMYVFDPTLDIKVWDLEQNKEVSGKNVVSGTRLTFRVDTNGYPVLTPRYNRFWPSASAGAGGPDDDAQKYTHFNPLWGNLKDPAAGGTQVNIEQMTWNGTYYGYNMSGFWVGNRSPQGYIDIKVKTPTGATLSNLYNGSTGAFQAAIPLTNLYVDNINWFWGNTTGQGTATSGTLINGGGPTQNFNWQTGAVDNSNQRYYPIGTYTITAEWNLNTMKDMYKNAGADYTGKTVSEAKTIQLVTDSVKIESDKDTVVRSNAFSLTVTGRPNTIYWVWVKGTTSMLGGFDDQAPMVSPFQAGVYNDTAPWVDSRDAAAISGIGDNTWGNMYVPQNKQIQPRVNAASGLQLTGPTVWGQVGRAPYNGSFYYCAIKTNENGVRTVQWVTTNNTKAQTYTFRVENATETAAGGSGLNPQMANFFSDEVSVKVEKGAVTITASGDGSYYLGEEVKFSGTNTETENTYVYITGPNLWATGASMTNTDPRSAAAQILTATPATAQAAGFAVRPVNADHTWDYRWGTATVALDAGTYTVYAVSWPNQANQLQNVAYGTVSIIIKKPFVSATVSQSTVAQGDKLFVRGTAEGKPGPGVAMWIMGKNYATRTTTGVNADASFEFEVREATTQNMAAGQYFVVIQHPMQNDQFDIVYNGDPPGGNGYVRNLQSGSGAGGIGGAGQDIFLLRGTGSLQGSDAAEALVEGINDPNVDDTYTKLQFLVEAPVIRIDAIGDRHVGDKFTITAQTNLAVDDEVLFEVYSSSFKPTQKSQSGEFSGATGVVKVAKGDTGMNKLSFDVDAATFKPDEYLVTANRVSQQPAATGTALFNVLEGPAPTAAPTTAAPTTAAPTTAATTAVPTTAEPAKTPTQPGFGAFIALIGLGAVAFLVVRRH
ncbi:MAG: hypothetical protein A4E35_00175 [Methanoregula sp. PtaU1.Bin051]|nr:MAG: hypothetical protein A4E35_00175 [Methanoregula sp. PtaU1.Bin051]